MKEIWKVLEKDIQSEDFTREEMVVFGVVCPVVLVAVLMVAAWLESLL